MHTNKHSLQGQENKNSNSKYEFKGDASGKNHDHEIILMIYCTPVSSSHGKRNYGTHLMGVIHHHNGNHLETASKYRYFDFWTFLGLVVVTVVETCAVDGQGRKRSW